MLDFSLNDTIILQEARDVIANYCLFDEEKERKVAKMDLGIEKNQFRYFSMKKRIKTYPLADR